jgi:hypothetical protein
MDSHRAHGPGSHPNGHDSVPTLVPGSEATPADVAKAHARLASAMAAGQTVESIVGSALLGPRPTLSGPIGRTPRGPNRVFLSGLPATLNSDGGVPDWAHGMLAPAVTPNMLTVDGLPVQLLGIDPLAQMTLIRDGRTEVLLSLPLLLPGPSNRSFLIDAGSLWVAAGPLAAAASGGFAGLRVTGGTLTADADLVVVGLRVVIPAGATATLTFELDQAASRPHTGGPGVDLESSQILVPKTATMVFAPSGVTLLPAAGATASLTAFGATVGLTAGSGAPVYGATTRDLTLPLATDTTEFTPVGSAQAVAAPAGSAPIVGAMWAIPVAFAAPESLGEAAGAGALRLVFGPGLSLAVPSLDLVVPLRRPSLSVGADVLELFGELAERSTAKILLWNTRAGGRALPGSSSVLFSGKAGSRVLLRERAGTEVVAWSGECSASLDRPLAAAGTRLRLEFPVATLLVARAVAGITCSLLGTRVTPITDARTSIALENALLLVDAAQSLSFTGRPVTGRIASGVLHLQFPLVNVVPILPDPYATNFDIHSDSVSIRGEIVTVDVAWQKPDDATVVVTTSPGGQGPPGAVFTIDGISLLDVSTSADLLGVTIDGQSAMRIDTSILSTSGRGLSIFTVPGISWEPVEVEDNSVLIEAPPNDGVRSAVKVTTVALLPLEPQPVLREFVGAAQAGAGAELEFMLPFGLFARGSLLPAAVPAQGASFELVTPPFPRDLQGALQLTLRPPRNAVPTASGFPGSLSARSQGAIDVIGPVVFNFVDGEFGPKAANPIVPVLRVDLSGYGTSMFSDWRSPVEATGVQEARFDVVVGRTSYEVIQVVSVLYPWGIRVVRTVTLARQAGGRVLRTDTGWQAQSDGLFDVPPGIVAHKGPVVRVTNVQNIADLSPDIPLAGTPPAADFEQVSFDADIEISPDLNVTDGGVKSATGTLVPSRGLNGYLQNRPIGTFISKGQLGELMQARTAGGPLACTVDLGGPGVAGPLVRVTGISVSAAVNAGTPEIVVALVGTPRLPANGQWSVGQHKPGDRAPRALDPSAVVPLIRANSSPDWHLADPSDINRLSAPTATQYGLLQATGTQRIFFRQPRAAKASPQFDLGEPPHLADVVSLLNGTGAFPDLDKTLQFNEPPPSIGAVGDTLTVQKREFSLAGLGPRTLLEIPPVKVMLAYADAQGTPAIASVEINPAGSPSWTITIGTVSILLAIPPFGTVDDPLLRLTGSIHADSDSAPNYKDLVVHFGGSMSLVEQVFSRLQELASLLPGGKSELKVTFADGRLTVRDSFTLPNLPLGIGQITDVGMNLGLTVTLSPRSVDFQVGIASPEEPFHWLVSPLSGTGAIVVGSTDGRPTILVQAGIGAGLAIDVGIASGSASVVLAVQVDNRVAPVELKVILTGQAAVDVLDGLASAALTLSAAMGIVPDELPIPHEIILFADVAVGIHLAVCWVASVDFDGSWHVQQTLTSPIS